MSDCLPHVVIAGLTKKYTAEDFRQLINDKAKDPEIYTYQQLVEELHYNTGDAFAFVKLNSEEAANCLIARLNESKLEGCDQVHATFIPKFGIACSLSQTLFSLEILLMKPKDQILQQKVQILVEMARVSVEVMVGRRMILLMTIYLIDLVGLVGNMKLELLMTLSNAKDGEQKKTTLNLVELIQVLLSKNMKKTMDSKMQVK
ncbi:unnamed protein product [Meloidogyne enterolobii]|uniref:Uncharacterized protein n=1 Tax=Meloidogyne enterolobii TaxID=390850 RepID=A0ACB0YZF0_MELEN